MHASGKAGAQDFSEFGDGPLANGAGYPRKLGISNVYTLDREHGQSRVASGLHHAKESGKKPCAGLKHHSPLRGESARGRSGRGRMGHGTLSGRGEASDM